MPFAADAKWVSPLLTADGKRRASVRPENLETLWFNTGTLCNLECVNCYIESSPSNDRLVYLSADEVRTFLAEVAAEKMGTREIGFTGGEPFLNPQLIEMLGSCLERGFAVLVLTNAMRPLMNKAEVLLDLRKRYGDRLRIRVSLDHYTKDGHEAQRGGGTWVKVLAGLSWLGKNGFQLSVAGRMLTGEDDKTLRAGYRRLFAGLGMQVDADDPARLVLFPEMDEKKDYPEITTECWGILNKKPSSVMCATSRMVIKRKGVVRVICTNKRHKQRQG